MFRSKEGKERGGESLLRPETIARSVQTIVRVIRVLKRCTNLLNEAQKLADRDVLRTEFRTVHLEDETPFIIECWTMQDKMIGCFRVRFAKTAHRGSETCFV